MCPFKSSFYIFHLHLLHSSEVKILHINLAILVSCTWTSIDIYKDKISPNSGQRSDFLSEANCVFP